MKQENLVLPTFKTNKTSLNYFVVTILFKMILFNSQIGLNSEKIEI